MEEKVTVNGLAEGLVILIEEIREQNQASAGGFLSWIRSFEC